MINARDWALDKSWSETCLKTLALLGVTEDTLQAGLNQVNMHNSSDGWSVQMSAVYSNSPAHNAAKIKFGNQTVSDYFSKNPGTSALAAPNGTAQQSARIMRLRRW
jgi:hypothetical protein